MSQGFPGPALCGGRFLLGSGIAAVAQKTTQLGRLGWVIFIFEAEITQVYCYCTLAQCWGCANGKHRNHNRGTPGLGAQKRESGSGFFYWGSNMHYATSSLWQNRTYGTHSWVCKMGIHQIQPYFVQKNWKVTNHKCLWGNLCSPPSPCCITKALATSSEMKLAPQIQICWICARVHASSLYTF